MQVEVRRHIAIDWPAPMGDKAGAVLRDLEERLTGIPHFVMGRTLLQLVRSGELDPKDTDIDVAVRFRHYHLVQEALADWPLAIETRYDGRIQQAMWYPQGILVDVHVFGPTERIGYATQSGKWATRPAEQFSPTFISTSHGDVAAPNNPEAFLTDDYGPYWETTELDPKWS